MEQVITKSNATIVELLLQKQNIGVNYTVYFQSNHFGQTALTTAFEAGNHEIVSLLLYQVGVGEGREGVFAMLLNENVGINLRDRNNRNALMLAAMEGHEGILAMLLDEDDIDIIATG